MYKMLSYSGDIYKIMDKTSVPMLDSLQHSRGVHCQISV